MAMSGKPDIADVPFESGLINGLGRFSDNSNVPLPDIKIKRGETLRLRLISGASNLSVSFSDRWPSAYRLCHRRARPLKPVEVDSILLSPGERYDVLLKGSGTNQHGFALSRWMEKKPKPCCFIPMAKPGRFPRRRSFGGKRELMPEQMKAPRPHQTGRQA